MNISYSQFGEDLPVDVFFSSKTTPGYYVDVGAHHPERFSNTHFLYKRGWRGINIDGDPALVAAFDLARPDDVNLTSFVSSRAQTATFHHFSDSAVNTLSNRKAAAYSQHWQLLSQVEIRNADPRRYPTRTPTVASKYQNEPLRDDWRG